MGYCDCKICNPDEDPVDRRPYTYSVTVKKEKSGYWSIPVGDKWVEIRGTHGMSFAEVKAKVFTDAFDVRAHPNSEHFFEEHGRG